MTTYELDDTEKRALLGKVAERARADLNDGQPLTEMRRVATTNPLEIREDEHVLDHALRVASDLPARRSLSEEQQELFKDASLLAYSAIRHSGLWKSLTNVQWDAKAATYGWLVVELLNGLIDADVTALNAADEEMDTWLSK